MYSFDKRRHREALWLIATGSLLGLIAAGGYLMLPLGYPEAARYFGSPPSESCKADEAGQLRTLMEDYFLLSVTGDDSDPARVEEIARFILHRFDGLTLEFAASRDIKAWQVQVDLLCESMLRVSLRG